MDSAAVNPIAFRVAVAGAIALFVAVFIVPEFWTETDAPLRPGSRMTFGVSEVSPVGSKAYPLRVYLHRRPGGALEIQVKSEHGERLLKVDRMLRPLDPTETLEFPLTRDQVVAPGTLWIAGGERVVNGMSSAGLVKRVLRYKSFKAVEVDGVDGKLYFELDTGILVGFEKRFGRHEVVGTLMSLQ